MSAREEDRSILSAPQPDPDQTIQFGPHAGDVADIYRSAHPSSDRCAIFLHGGFWRPAIDRRHARPFVTAMAQSGWNACLIEYGREPGNPDQSVADVERGIDRVPALAGCGSAAPLIVGHSAGGHLALLAAMRGRVELAAVVGLAPVSDLARAYDLGLGNGAVREFLGGSAGRRADLDPARGRMADPLVVLHGRFDSIVPVEMSLTTVPTLGDDCAVIVAEDAAHFELIAPSHPAGVRVLDAMDDLWLKLIDPLR